MDLSLDEYIAISKKIGNDDITNNCSNLVKSSSNNSKFGRRKDSIDDEEEEDDKDTVLTEKTLGGSLNTGYNSSTIWKGPDSSISYLDCNDKQNDLREKLNGTNKCTENFSSAQYRLNSLSGADNFSRDVSALLPLDAYVSKRTNEKKRKICRGRRYKKFQQDTKYEKKTFQNDNCYFGTDLNNDRKHQNGKQKNERKNLRLSVNWNMTTRKSEIKNFHDMASHKTQNMIIETPSNFINLKPSKPLNSCFKVPRPSTGSDNHQHVTVDNLTSQSVAALKLNANNHWSTTNNNNNENLKSLLGFHGNMSADMMPVFANRLMEFIQKGLQTTVHKPIYDMKIQKDIHELQKKPLLYKCPGGEIVSSDGAGVNCKIIPRTSGVSLNYRFA